MLLEFIALSAFVFISLGSLKCVGEAKAAGAAAKLSPWLQGLINHLLDVNIKVMNIRKTAFEDSLLDNSKISRNLSP